jgi:hypothetical protein
VDGMDLDGTPVTPAENGHSREDMEDEVDFDGDIMVNQ